MKYALGMMCGTSADGISVAIIEWPERPKPPPALVAHRNMAFAPSLRAGLFRLYPPGTTTAHEVLQLHAAVGAALAEAARQIVAEANLGTGDLWLAAVQGPIAYYDPQMGALELGDPAHVAAALGVPVVNQLRAKDMAYGGRGAPLTSWFDWWMLSEPAQGASPAGDTATGWRAVLNLGGIANLTLLPPDGAPDGVMAFDVGPGNMVIDGVVQRLSGGTDTLDRDGLRAAAGRVQAGLLAELLQHPYFRQRPPKTTGRELFGGPYVDALMGRAAELGVGGNDLVATVTALTAEATRRALVDVLPSPAPAAGPVPALGDLFVCGGGALNPTLMAQLSTRLPHVRVRRYDELGVPAEAREAVAWAVMGAFSVMGGRAVTLPGVTGASRAVRLGSLTFPD